MIYYVRMNEHDLISHIEELGLSNKEAKVYVACLKTGPSAVQRIADQAGIKRVTTYVILESLVGLGLVSQSVKGKKTYFIAEEPSNLSRLLDKREQELKDQKNNFEQILPELLSLKTIPEESPDVKYYDSADAILTLYSTLYRENPTNANEVYEISNPDQVSNFFSSLGEGRPNPDRMAYGIHDYFLYTSAEGPTYAATDKEFNRESRYVSPGDYPITGNLSILGDKVVLISLTGSRPIGIVINSHEIAQTMKTVFKMAWDSAENQPN